jgi:hypothetical protein
MTGVDAVTSGPMAAVTAADMMAGHVSLDISCLDRLYLTGFVPKLQTPGGVIYFLHDHRGNPITSPAVFEQIGNRFRACGARIFSHGPDLQVLIGPRSPSRAV